MSETAQKQPAPGATPSAAPSPALSPTPAPPTGASALETPPPLLGQWRNLYVLVMVALVVCIALGWLMTRVYG